MLLIIVFVTSMTTVLRLATHEDIDSVMIIINTVVPLMNAEDNYQWDNVYPTQEIFVNDIEEKQLWVTEVNGVIAGVGALTTQQPDEYKTVGWDINTPCIVPHRVAVRPDYRNLGLAKLIIQHADVLAKERGYDYVRIDTCTKNKAMNALFVKLGFQYVGQLSFLSKPPGMRFNCYDKKI